MSDQDHINPDSILRVALICAGLLSAAPGCGENARQPPMGPPPAAIAACQGQSHGLPCQFKDQDHLITGTCQVRGSDWVCVPDRPPPGDRLLPNEAAQVSAGQASLGTQVPPRPPQEALDACLGRQEGADCMVKTPRGLVSGRCGPDRAGLVCIPRDPNQGPGSPAGIKP